MEYKTLQLRRMIRSIRKSLRLLYPPSPQIKLSSEQRNMLIRQKYEAGEGLSDLARYYGITPQRVYQILHTKETEGFQ